VFPLDVDTAAAHRDPSIWRRMGHAIFSPSPLMIENVTFAFSAGVLGGDGMFLFRPAVLLAPHVALEATVGETVGNQADVVYGSRFLQRANSPKIHQWVNKFLTTLSNGFTGLKLTDMETCYKIARAQFIRNIRLRSQRFGMEPEMTAKLARSGARFVELPISDRFRNYAEGKKINAWDGIKAIFAIVYFHFRD
jgi:hypothetical protein